MNLEDEWTLANVIDAAVDEQRRRNDLDPLPPRTDDHDAWPSGRDPRRWPGVWTGSRRLSARYPCSGRELVSTLPLRDDDLRITVVNVYDSLRSRFFTGIDNIAVGVNAVCTTAGSGNVAIGATALDVSTDEEP
jgi:hypothetical protein